VSQQQQDTQGIRVFVYGTLKRLHHNHNVMDARGPDGTQLLGLCYVQGPYQMRDMKWFPGVQFMADPVVKNKIYGEVYRVNKQVLDRLDILEGNGHFFTRMQIETPWKKAWMYCIPSSYDEGRPILPGGVWKPSPIEKKFIASGELAMPAADYFALAQTPAA
jgi:gamma-glutamylcyclotransferase (GGCT)/AIG2-like uncharacterized protein YtfP